MPTGPIQYPPLGSLVSKELGSDESALPNCVSIAPYRFFNPAAWGPGFLGPKYAPLVVADNAQGFRPGTATRVLQPGQRTVFPAALSETFNFFLHSGQVRSMCHLAVG